MTAPGAAETEALRRQQGALARFSTMALGEKKLAAILHEAVEQVAACLGASRAKVLEYLPAENRFCVRAGIGWKPGTIGEATVGADLESPAGYAFKMRQPVIASDLRREQRFRYPALLQDHGVVSAVNVIIQCERLRYGVLEVDHAEAREFGADDVAFLLGFANVIAAAVDRQRTEQALHELIGEKDLLLREINHRVKNNLALVTAMLTLQGKRSGDESVRAELRKASDRVQTIVLMHDRLHGAVSLQPVPVADLLRDLAQMLRDLTPPDVSVRVDAEGGTLDPEQVLPLAMLINELAFNAAKHAFPQGGQGEIRIGFAREGRAWRLSVADNGVGMPPEAESQNGSLGMQIVRALVQQLDGEMQVRRAGGTTVEVTGGG